MTEPAITVTITDSEFTVGELQEFLDTVRKVEGMRANALVAVRLENATTTTSQGGPLEFTLAASTAYGEKE